MLHTLRNAFRKFRTIVGAFRASLYGVALVLAGWIFIAPPSPTETAKLGLAQNATAQTDVLRKHRMAKVLLMVGTDRTYGLIASRAGNGLTADDVRLSVQITAQGRPIVEDAQFESAADTATKEPTNTGAKFVTARSN